MISDDLLTRFLKAATWHGSLDEAEALLAAHPDLAGASIHAAAVLGDEAAVRRFIAQDPASATAKAPPHGGDALNYLGLSKYLRLRRERTGDFLRTATALLDAGAPAETGFWTSPPHAEFETALYGAAGVAHNEPLTRLLLARGANPRDVDALYHAPEGDDLGVLAAFLETGKLGPEDHAILLIRKHDWHHHEGIKFLLEHGVDPNSTWRDHWPIHHAIARDNGAGMVELLLDHGARAPVVQDGLTAIARAARRGRGDLLAIFERRGIPLGLDGVDRLIAACARDDGATVRDLARRQPGLVEQVRAMGGTLLAEFAGCWNAAGVGHLLDLGVPVTARYQGDGYFGIPKDSTALHVAAWKSTPPAVLLLIARGADVNATDGDGRTPLMLAVKACVESYWTERRRTDAARALLDAGAAVEGVRYPCGWDELDSLLAAHGAVAGRPRHPGA